MDSNIVFSDVVHGDWTVHDNEVVISSEEVLPAVTKTEVISDAEKVSGEEQSHENDEVIDIESHSDLEDLDKEPTNNIHESMHPSSAPMPHDPNVYMSPQYFESVVRQEPIPQQFLYYPGFAHGYSVSSTYHQPFVSMVRQKKTSALATVLGYSLRPPVPTQHIAQSHIDYVPRYPFGYENQYSQQVDVNYNELINEEQDVKISCTISKNPHENKSTRFENVEEKDCCRENVSCIPSRPIPSFGLSTEETSNDFSTGASHGKSKEARQNHRIARVADYVDGGLLDGGISRHQTDEALGTDNGDTGAIEVESEDENDEIVVVDDEGDIGAAPTTAVSDKDDAEEAATSSGGTKHQKSPLEKLLLQPVKKRLYSEYPPFAVAFSAIGNPPLPSGQHPPSPKRMQFYQPPAQQHLARNTPPPGFAQPYGMGMRPHEEETRQIMNLDSQQTHNSSPTSSWNQPYPMTNLNAYQQRGPNIYAAPVPPQMVHQNGPPGVVPTSNPYYPAPGPPPSHHHIQPQAPMMPPGMHGQQQQQQPYYNTQSPLTGSSASMNYGSSQMPVPPPATNGSTPIFNFSKPRSSNEGSSANGGGHRRKKHNDLSSPRYNSNGSEDVDGSIFPDMSDFPLLDVVQSKAKKDAGRKPCRPHLCEQSRMLISRVCHFHREFVKRLPSRHPLANSPFSKPDQWTSQIMGISLATVRKCIDMAVDEEVFTRCTDKNLVNLTPSERAEREELLSKLSTVFEDEKTLGAGTAGMTIAEYSPRRSYSNTLVRQSTDDKSSNSSFANGADYGSSETTLLNLDDHSNHSKDFASTPTAELNNGGQIYEELGSIGGGTQESEDKSTPAVETPKRGRPRKTPGMPAKSSSKQHQSQEDSEMSEDKEEHEKKTEDEDETTEESEKKSEETEQLVLAAERDDDAASSEGTNRSETATPEPAADTSVAKKTRAAARRKNTRTIEEELPAAAKKKRGSVTAATAGVPGLDDENSDHKMVTRARSRQP
ncbi:hypothetical protein L5515_011596 [Caenorhabditis briggsae]|uniref:Uncharacterized protein n=4 Tax=Caenorhabditis briggsae TaxID=6238 RepID=A0AAE9JEM1_CAEBR|nr:hypothetical protein L5515_011596 [Caenorhabditis briggsae]